MPVTQILSVVGRGGGTTPPPPPQPSGLYAWEWDSDHLSGNTISNTAYTGNGSNGTTDQNVPLTLNGGWNNSGITWYNGNSGLQVWPSSSASFMQTPDFVQSAYSSAWASGTRTGLTIELWFYPTTGARTLVSEQGAGGAGNATWRDNIIELNSNGTIVADIWPYDGVPITTANSVNYNAWNHVIYTYNISTTTLSIQLNGGVIASNSSKSWTCGVEGGNGLYYALGYADATNLMANANTTNFDGYWGKVRIANYPMASNRVSDWAKYSSFSVVDSGTALGASWTVEVVGEFFPSNFWATMWGNEAWTPGTGHLAYLTSPSTMSVGAPNVQFEYNLADSVGIKAYWAFTHTNGGGINVYRNGVLLTPVASNYVQPSVASNTLIFGARHLNDGTGGTGSNVLDKLPGNYLYTNISASALSPATIASNFTTLQSTYGL